MRSSSAALRAARAREPDRGARAAGARAGRVAPVRRRHRPDGAARSGEAARGPLSEPLGPARAAAGSRSQTTRSSVGALTTYTEVMRSEALQAECPLLCRAAARDRRRRDPEPRHDRRQHRQRLARRRYAAGAARLRRRARAACRSAASGACSYDRFHPGYKQMDLAPDEIVQRSACRAAAAAGCPATARSGRGARRRSRRCASRRRSICTGTAPCATSASRSAAWRRPSCAPRAPRPRSAGARSPTRPSPRAATRLSRDISPIDDLRSTAEYRLRVARNLLEEFLTSAVM